MLVQGTEASRGWICCVTQEVWAGRGSVRRNSQCGEPTGMSRAPSGCVVRCGFIAEQGRREIQPESPSEIGCGERVPNEANVSYLLRNCPVTEVF